MSISMKQEDGKYIVDLGLKWIDDKIVMPDLKEEVLKEDIERMLPEGFSFKEGVFSKDKPSHGVWQQRKFLRSNTICCEVVRRHQDYRTPDGMATWYWTYHISIWYTVGKFLSISLGNEEELDAICREIAQMIGDKYEVKDRVTIEHIPVLLREKLGENFEPEKIVGYQYSIGYITEDWDLPIEDYYCEKEEYWLDETHKKTEKNGLEELEDISRWDKEIVGRFDSQQRGYFEQFYKADNGQWPALCWACIDVFMADGNNEKPIRMEAKNCEDVVSGAFEELRLWLENRFRK